MGLYIEVPANKGKADLILDLDPRVEEATYEDGTFFIPDWDDAPKGFLPVCVVDNGPFEAAGVAYSEEELIRFSRLDDPRPRRWLYVPIDVIKKHAPMADIYLKDEEA